jgi:peptidoglycan hydrolase-like protein with peptidoglycan-binding domain
MSRLLAISSILVLALGGPALAQNAEPGTAAPSSSAGMAMSAAQVKQAQNALKQQGLYDGEIDGILGPQTKTALTQFQKKEGLQQSAELDPQTYSRLMSMAGQSGSSMKPGASSGSTSGMAPSGQPAH